MKEKREKSLWVKLLTRLLVPIILLAGICGGGYFGLKKLKANFLAAEIEKRYASVSKQLVSCSELVTMKMKYTDIITIKKKTMLSKSYSIVKYSGIIRAGVPNIEDADFRISDDGNTLEIILPDVAILGNEISYQEVFDEQRSIFIPISTQEIFEEIETSKNLMTEQAINDGILTDARIQSEKIVRGIMLAIGFENVIIY